MALTIKKQDNVFYLTGKFTSNCAYQVREFFMAKLKRDDGLIINLSGLDDLDLSAAMLLNDLYERGRIEYKIVSILFMHNKKIKGPFRQLEFYPELNAA